MKKLLIIIMIVMATAIASKADEGFGTCQIPGTSDYVEGTAYLTLSGSTVSGNLVISNASARPLQSASITVSVRYIGKYTKKITIDRYPYANEVKEEIKDFEQTATVYNSRWTGTIAGYQSGEVSISSELKLPNNTTEVSIKEISVSISNPYCMAKQAQQ